MKSEATGSEDIFTKYISEKVLVFRIWKTLTTQLEDKPI